MNHGPKLSLQDYERRIVALQSDLPPLLSKDQDRDLRRAELELTIDHRLGQDFPRARRDQLWAVQQKIDKKRLRIALKYVIKRFFSRALAEDAQKLAGLLVDEYKQVLNQEELESFFGPEEARHPSLPIDQESG